MPHTGFHRQNSGEDPLERHDGSPYWPTKGNASFWTATGFGHLASADTKVSASITAGPQVRNIPLIATAFRTKMTQGRQVVTGSGFMMLDSCRKCQ